MLRSLTIVSMILLLGATAFSDVPRTISYQGRLVQNGIPVNGFRTVTFTIYDVYGTPIWNSGQFQTVFTEGLFTVELGRYPQPPLPEFEWTYDTAMTLGIAFPPDPELYPRLSFKSVPYAIHALTAQTAANAGGWQDFGGGSRLANPNGVVAVGMYDPYAKTAIMPTGSQYGLHISSQGSDLYYPAFYLESENNTGAIFRRGVSYIWPVTPLPAVYAVNTVKLGSAAWFRSYSQVYSSLYVESDSAGGSITTWNPRGYGLDSWWGKGIRSSTDSATAIRAESQCSDEQATVLSSAYVGGMAYDHIAISGYSRPSDYYGIGGLFEGGYNGVVALVNPTGNSSYYAVIGRAEGGSGGNWGVNGLAIGAGYNVGVYGYASGGYANYAGYFNGDVDVTGTLWNAKSALTIDHPTDPDGAFLQQGGIVSDNLKTVYDGVVTLSSDGTAIVQLPDYLESFCGDFRYQLTCIGGYAPVYVASKIADSRFTIAGGTPGLEVSWQITGIRKDKYAQANPIEVEKKKTASQLGKYLHPELYGYGADKSLSPNPAANAELKAKDDAIRAATEALKKPSTPPAMPQMVEKK